MVQHDSYGEIYFLHRNLLKWDITKDNEFVWEKIVRFLPDAIERKYYLKNPGLGRYYMDLSGDIEVLDFKELLGNYEQMCLNFLKTWRHSQIFKRFIEYSYFATRRYPGGEPFSLY
jgi:alpha 1,2-mannosyltransferase